MEEAGNRWGFNGKGRWAHRGMMRAAEAIREDLEKTGLLNTIFGRIPEPSADVGLTTPLSRVNISLCSHRIDYRTHPHTNYLSNRSVCFIENSLCSLRISDDWSLIG